MQNQTKIVEDSLALATRLATIGLTLELTHELRLTWAAAQASATDFEPRMAGAMRGWFASIGLLRERKALHGWIPQDVRNWPVVVDQNSGIALTITSGDEWTGVADGARHPSTKNPKGIVVATAIKRNLQQLMFPAGVMGYPPVVRLKTRLAPLTWFMLIATTQHELRAEVSLPAEIVNKRIVRWDERLVLPAIRREPQPGVPRHDEKSFDEAPAINVPVARK